MRTEDLTINDARTFWLATAPKSLPVRASYYQGEGEPLIHKLHEAIHEGRLYDAHQLLDVAQDSFLGWVDRMADTGTHLEGVLEYMKDRLEMGEEP